MRNIFIGIAAILLGISSAQAQTEKEDLQDFPETMQTDMDSLYWDWQSKNFLFVDENCRMLPDGPKVSDSVYIDRLSRIPSIIEMPFNDVVKKYIEAYTGRLRNKVSFMLAAANFYMPIFEEALDTYAPNRIIIEPSGVGKLSDVIAAVEKVEGVQLGYTVAVVDAGKVKVYMKNFGEFYNNQIETASTIILSRTDSIRDE